MDNEFKEEHNVTIGVEFGSYVLKMDNKIVKLQIWDTVSPQRFWLSRLDKNPSEVSLESFTEELIVYF